MPKVSLCIPTYNRANFLKYAIASVLQQAYADWELIVCDDASSDETASLMEQYQDDRIRYIQHPVNQGRSQNMRSGFEAAKGDYFIKFDDDDALTPQFLEKTVAILDANPDVDFVCTSHWIIDGAGNQIQDATQANLVKWGKDRLSAGVLPNLLQETFQHQSLQVGSTLFRRQCLAAVDYMRPEADGCEDFDLLVRLAIAGKQGYFLPELLMEYRMHGGQTSLKQDIHFLNAKLFCSSGYRFDDRDLEALRKRKVAELQQALGLRLIENGESQTGRELLQHANRALGRSAKSLLGMTLSYLPTSWRKAALQAFRQLRPKDYAEQVRSSVS